MRDKTKCRCSCRTVAVRVFIGTGRVLARTRSVLDLSRVLSGHFKILDQLTDLDTACDLILAIHGSAVNQ